MCASHNGHHLADRSDLRHIMLDWMLKKNKVPLADRGEAAASDLEAGGHPVQAEADTASAINWDQKLQAAMGDDTALLALARASAPIGVKVAAIGALTGEAALKLAEREHRDRDRRVHRLAKQRHLAQVALPRNCRASRPLDRGRESFDRRTIDPGQRPRQARS